MLSFYGIIVFSGANSSIVYGTSREMARNHDNSSRSGGGRGGRGRGGRGKGKKKADGSKNNAPKKKTELKDYIFKVGSARRSNECEENIKYMLRHLTTALVGDTKHLITYLEEGSVTITKPSVDDIPYDLPKTAGELETPLQKRKNDNLAKEYDNQVLVYHEQTRVLEQHKREAYALLFNQCDSSMQAKITNHKDYKTIKDDPYQLLTYIRQFASSIVDTKYPSEVFVNTLLDLLSCKQKEGESLNDYAIRFKHQRDLFKTQAGGQFPIIYKDIIEKTSVKTNHSLITLDETNTDLWNDNDDIWSVIFGWLYLNNADPMKYADLHRKCKEEYALASKVDRYPKSIDSAMHTMETRGFDDQYSERKKNREKARQKSSNDSKNKEKTEDDRQILAGFNQALRGKCRCCGSTDHMQAGCNQTSKPRHLWFDRQIAQQGAQHAQTAMVPSQGAPPAANQDDAQSQATSGSAPSEGRILELPNAGYAQSSGNRFVAESQRRRGVNHAMLVRVPVTKTDGTSMGDVVLMKQLMNVFDLLLDTGSSVHLVGASKYVSNIRKSATPIELQTTGGPVLLDTECDYTRFGRGSTFTAYFFPKTMVDILSFGLLDETFRVSFMDHAFQVAMPNGRVAIFTKNDQRVYTLSSEKPVQLVQTVAERASMLNQRQLAGVQRCRDWYHALGCPPISDLKVALKLNTFANCPITNEDINNMVKVYGRDVAVQKGKNTRTAKVPYEADKVLEIPPELEEKTTALCIDLLYVQGTAYLTTITKGLMYRTATSIPNNKVPTIRVALDDVLSMYADADIHIQTIHCDKEFKPLFEHLNKEEWSIQLEIEPAQRHQKEAERNNQTIQGRVRSVYHRLPFRNLPHPMWEHLVPYCAKALNFYPPKGSLHRFYSPHQIVHKRTLDFKRHCTIPFGSYVTVPQDNGNRTNTQEPRVLDGIYLGPTDNETAGVRVMDLVTGRVITRSYATKCPISESVIHRVNQLAEKDATLGLIVKTKRGKVLFDSSWIAGVDYHPSTGDEIIYEDEYGSDEEPEEEYDTDMEYDTELEEEEVDALMEERDRDLEELLQRRTIRDDESVDEDLLSDAQGDDEVSIQEQSQQESDIEEEDSSGNELEDSNHVPPKEEDEESNASQDEDGNRRSKRLAKKPRPYYAESHIPVETILEPEDPETADAFVYEDDEAPLIAAIICYFYQAYGADYHDKMIKKYRKHVYSTKKRWRNVTLTQTYTLSKALRKWGGRARAAAMKEMKQLHDRDCFGPLDISTLTPTERKRALESFMFLVEKKDGTVKARTVGNGSTQRQWMGKEETSSPTVTTTSVFMTAVIDAQERRSVATADVPNAFIQTKLRELDKDGQRYVLKIRGELVDMLVQIAPEVYGPSVVIERDQKVLYLQTLKALYGMLESSLLYYKKWRKSLEDIGFKVNPYDPCVANKMVNGRQLTVCWHVDDLKVSHVEQRVVDEFLEWVQLEYGQYGEVKICRGERHPYVGFTMDFSEPGAVLIDMRDYVAQMVKDFPEEVKGTIKTPAAEGLFDINQGSKLLSKERKEAFHSSVAQGLFLAKRGRPDVLPAIAFLCTRVTKPTEEDWRKLKRVIQWLKCTKEDVLRLKSDGKPVLHWYGDASFAVHPDFKSHTGGVLTMGNGCIAAYSMKHKINTRSSTEAELIAVDDLMAEVLWSKQFLEAQGQTVEVVIHQDNQSTMRLMTNGRQSVGKRSRHLNIRFFFVKDIYDRKLLSIVYCPTDDMLGDYFTKPVQGKKFIHLNDKVMGRRHHKEKYDEAKIAVHRGPICAMTLVRPALLDREVIETSTLDTRGDVVRHRITPWHSFRPFNVEEMYGSWGDPVQFRLQSANDIMFMWADTTLGDRFTEDVRNHFLGREHVRSRRTYPPPRYVKMVRFEEVMYIRGHRVVHVHETPTERPTHFTRDMSLQDCMAALNDDLYRLIWDMYLSLETAEARDLCFKKAHQAHETSIYNERRGWETVMLVDLPMYLRYDHKILITNVTVCVGNCNWCYACGNTGYKCKTCHRGYYATVQYTHPFGRPTTERFPWILAEAFGQKSWMPFIDIQDLMDPETRVAHVTSKKGRSIDGIIQSIQRLGRPSSFREWELLWRCLPFSLDEFRHRYTEITGQVLPDDPIIH